MVAVILIMTWGAWVIVEVYRIAEAHLGYHRIQQKSPETIA
jgi:hypothetical protein